MFDSCCYCPTTLLRQSLVLQKNGNVENARVQDERHMPL